jgi:hypothetical protein
MESPDSASEYAMPARMWRHGIHSFLSFLELLRHHLPASLDHMLAFIYLAYDIMIIDFATLTQIKLACYTLSLL